MVVIKFILLKEKNLLLKYLNIYTFTYISMYTYIILCVYENRKQHERTLDKLIDIQIKM